MARDTILLHVYVLYKHTHTHSHQRQRSKKNTSTGFGPHLEVAFIEQILRHLAGDKGVG